jgi:hypothetical protein
VSGLVGYLFNQVAGRIAGGAVGAGPSGNSQSIAAGLGRGLDAIGATVLDGIALTYSVGVEVGEALRANAHTNSNDSNRGTWVYLLVHRETGEILKFGITSALIPEQRYSQWFYTATNSDMVRFSYEPNRATARGIEYGLCTGYQASNNGNKPALSVRC